MKVLSRTSAAAVLCGCAASVVVVSTLLLSSSTAHAKLADRSRVVKRRLETGHNNNNNGYGNSYHDNGRPLEGPKYRYTAQLQEQHPQTTQQNLRQKQQQQQDQLQEMPWKLEFSNNRPLQGDTSSSSASRELSSQLSGCCYNYQKYSAQSLCAMYGNDCESGSTKSHDSSDGGCTQDGLSFIGISFSVNTASGNPYSYQLNDQFPMESIIDRDYNYVMSMDEDGWLVGGGYKTFDYSGKMPYIDSSHTELLRIGNMNPKLGGTSIDQVYQAMSAISFAPFSIYPNYVKGGGGHHSGDSSSSGVPSGDVTLVVSIVETYEDDKSYSSYESFVNDLFTAMYNVGGGPCMDDHDTDPHVSMSRGVKFWSSYHSQQYQYAANLEVAVWQAMYPKGVPIGSSGYAAFPPGRGGTKQKVGYGNLYFFFDRANITKAFSPYRSLTSSEEYYATLYRTSDTSSYYSKTTSVSYSGGSNDKNNGNWEWNPYSWNQQSAKHDMTDGWQLPPNCLQEGETFFGIPLSRTSTSKLQSTTSFQEQFDFEYLVDRNGTYIKSFGTNHGWLVGEELDNAIGAIVDKDTAHIPLFYTGTTNPNMGGMSLGDLIKVAKKLEFGTLYIKPAFVFVDSDGHLKLQFEADTTSALAYLYDNLCKELGISWNYESPSNSVGVYSNCAMHAAGDRAAYGCGPDGTGSGGFCPQMVLAYSPRFISEDYAAAYMYRCNNYVDYWRSLYPSGVAVGTSHFCPSGGCLGLFLNRLDLYEVFKPDLGGAWVEYNGASMPPTYSPAPTWKGGCDDPHNYFLDKCVRKRYKPKPSAVAWDALGTVGQISVMLVIFMAVTLSVSIFLARARKKRKRGESYLGFFFRDLSRKRRKKRKKISGNKELSESMLGGGGGDAKSLRSKSSARRSKSSSRAMASGRRSKSAGSRGRSSRTPTTSSGTSSGSAIRPVSVQPRYSRRSRDRGSASRGQSSGGSVGSASQLSGVFDLAISNPQPDDGKDNRQQLV